MKSPLVEALRQASGDADSEKSESTSVDAPTEQEPQVDEGEQASDADDLQLMQTSAGLKLEGGILPIDGGGILPIDGGGILAIDGADDVAADARPAANEDADTDEAADAEFTASTALQVSNDETLPDVAADEHVPPALPPLSDMPRHSHMPRLGLYSPLLCLALAAAATGGYFAYQKVGGWYHNIDLESLSSQIAAPALADSVPAARNDDVESRFALIVGPQTAPRRNAPVAPTQTRSTGNVPSSREAPIGRRASRAASTALASQRFDDRALIFLHEAYAAFERGDYAAAEAGYRRALDIAPRHPNALHGLAAILQRSGRDAEAMEYYAVLLSVEPNNAAAVVALLAGDRGDAADESEIKHLIQRYPESAQLQFALGSFYVRGSRWAEARHAFDKAVRLDPGNADYFFNLAVSLEHLGQYIDARYYYESALAAANATSVLDSGVVTARLQQLELLSKRETLVR